MSELQALVNIGSDLAKLVPGRVSTEVDARLAYDTHGIVRKVKSLKIPSFFPFFLRKTFYKITYSSLGS